MEIPELATTFPRRPQPRSKKAKFSKVGVVSSHFKFSLVKFEEEASNLRFVGWSVEVDASQEKDSRSYFERVVQELRRQIWDRIGYFMLSGQKIYSVYNETVNKYHKLLDSEGKDVVLNQNNDVLSFEQVCGDQQMDAEQCKFANLLLKKQNERLGLMELGRNKKYYDLGRMNKITKNEGNLLIFSGVLTSVLSYESGLLVNLDLSTRIIREKSLWEEMKEALNGKATRAERESYIEDSVIGRSFMLKHSNDRIVRVDAVDLKTKVTTAFPNPKYKNFVDYYLRHHNFPLVDQDQLMCVCYEKDYHFKKKGLGKGQEVFTDGKGEYIQKTILFPAEALRPTGITDEMAADFDVMKRIAEFTKFSPGERMGRIQGFIEKHNRLAEEDKKKVSGKKRFVDLFRQFHLRIDPDSNRMEGLQLMPPTLTFGNSTQKGKKKKKKKVVGNKMTPDIKNSNFIMEMPVLDDKTVISKWVLLYSQEFEYDHDDIIRKLQTDYQSLQIKVRTYYRNSGDIFTY